jgi:hypothetical protein
MTRDIRTLLGVARALLLVLYLEPLLIHLDRRIHYPCSLYTRESIPIGDRLLRPPTFTNCARSLVVRYADTLSNQVLVSGDDELHASGPIVSFLSSQTSISICSTRIDSHLQDTRGAAIATVPPEWLQMERSRGRPIIRTRSFIVGRSEPTDSSCRPIRWTCSFIGRTSIPTDSLCARIKTEAETRAK